MAGAKKGYPSTCQHPGVHFIGGSFVTAAGAAPTTLTGSGVSYGAPTAGGVYTLTLADGPFAGVVTGFVDIEDSTLNSTARVRFGDLDAINSAGTFTIVTSSAAGTDAQLTGPKVTWGLWLRNTSIEK